MISKIMRILVCLIVICTVGTGVNAEDSLDFGKHTKCLAVTISSTGEVSYFKYMDQGPKNPHYPEAIQTRYEFEKFDGSKVSYSRYSISKIQEIELSDHIKDLIREQLIENSMQYPPVSKQTQQDKIDLSKVTSLYYRSLIRMKLDEAEQYRTEIKETKTAILLRWKNSNTFIRGYGNVSPGRKYGKYDLDDSKKIKALNAKADQCDAEAKQLYKEYLHKLK